MGDYFAGGRQSSNVMPAPNVPDPVFDRMQAQVLAKLYDSANRNMDKPQFSEDEYIAKMLEQNDQPYNAEAYIDNISPPEQQTSSHRKSLR